MAYNGDDTEDVCPNPAKSELNGLNLMEEDHACAWPSSSSICSNRWSNTLFIFDAEDPCTDAAPPPLEVVPTVLGILADIREVWSQPAH